MIASSGRVISRILMNVQNFETLFIEVIEHPNHITPASDISERFRSQPPFMLCAFLRHQAIRADV
jgi:hypothetical protein